MKKAIIIIFWLSCFNIQPANSADGVINFNGEIVATACKVDPVSANQTVSLGKVSSSSFTTTNSTASSVPFKIKLTACDAAITRVAVRFDGMADARNIEILAVSGGATGVGIAIYETNNILLPLNKKSLIKLLASDQTSSELNFVAKYMATVPKESMTTGMANSTVQFTIDYD